MIHIDRRSTNHVFEKQNLVTQKDRHGTYDEYKCSACGLTGRSYRLGEISVSDRFSVKAHNCPNAPKVKKIRITNCHAAGKAFDNLTPGSVHDVVDPPAGYDNSRGVWVMGVGEPVKVLFNEYEEVEEEA